MAQGKKRVCDCGCGNKLTAKTISRHQAGCARPSVSASAILAGQVSSSTIVRTQNQQRQRSKTHGTLLNALAQIPGDAYSTSGLMPNKESDMEIDNVDNHLRNSSTPASSAGILRSHPALDQAANVLWSEQARSCQVTIEEVEDEDNQIPATNKDFNSQEEESWDPTEDNEDEVQEWIRQMENALRQETEELLANAPLSSQDRAVLRAIAAKLKHNMTTACFEDLPFLDSPPSFDKYPSWKTAQTRLLLISGLKPVLYDCCINSCCCYAGPNSNLDKCPHCSERRRDSRSRPRRRFSYLPLIPRLITYFKNAEQRRKMRYQHNFEHNPHLVTDIFDGAHYQSLLGKHVTVNGDSIESRCAHQYFEQPDNIALGLSTDGYAPFKRRKKTAWPLLIYIYNLPPDKRFLLENILALGVIPGPNKPADFDSFIWPAVEELLTLELGVDVWDMDAGSLAHLCAWLLVVFGDIPAMSMIMRMKGHNSFCPCRFCMIKGVKIPNIERSPYYVPLDRSRHPESASSDGLTSYDPECLPTRTHESFMQQAHQVQFATSTAEHKQLAKEYGIKGIPLLSWLSSLSFPASFPYDFMHLIWENVVKTLMSLWLEDFKGLNEGIGRYRLPKAIIKRVGELSVAAGRNIPYDFGPPPPDISAEALSWTADTRSFWFQHIGPVLLKDCLRAPYHKHYVQLVKLISYCLEFEMPREKVQVLRTGFADWVKAYERLYYQYTPLRLGTCTLNIHALLHIAESINAMGPVWACWAFPTKRKIGKIQRTVKGRQFVWSSIDKFVLHEAQLSLVKLKYPSYRSELQLRPKSLPSGEAVGNYPALKRLVVKPSTLDVALPTYQLRLLAEALVLRPTLATKRATEIYNMLKHTSITSWRGLCVMDGGDYIRACAGDSGYLDAREASWVQYDKMIIRRGRRGQSSHDEISANYGCVLNVYSFELPIGDSTDATLPSVFAYAEIRSVKLDEQNDLDLGRKFYKHEGPLDMVDISLINCKIGRFRYTNKVKQWALVDRTNMVSGNAQLDE